MFFEMSLRNRLCFFKHFLERNGKHGFSFTIIPQLRQVIRVILNNRPVNFEAEEFGLKMTSKYPTIIE